MPGVAGPPDAVATPRAAGTAGRTRPHRPPGPEHLPPSSGWFPVSSCGAGCLPPRRDPAASTVLVVARLCGLVAVLLATFAGVAVLAGSARDRWLCCCYRAVLRCCGVRVRIAGGFGGGELLAVNHLSWIEVLAVGAQRPVRIVAKRETGDWPLIGGVARRAGALFVDRAGLRGLRGTVAATAAALRAGADVAVFPEGTTWCGAAAGPFRRAVFQAAIDAGAPVRPVAVVLRRPGGERAPDAAFIGEQSLWDSLLRVLRLPSLECELTVLPPLAPSADRRELARRAGDAVAAVTGVPHHPDNRVRSASAA